VGFASLSIAVLPRLWG